jgi:mono/diheme cytochrome c family protein
VAIGVLPLAGCKDIKNLKAIVFTRPSERMPQHQKVAVSFEEQNWSPAQREWFYHAGQGTVLLPYTWFMALERPELELFGPVEKFSDSAYLERFGFLPSEASPENPDRLPVGFARETIVDPQSGKPVVVAGLTCAACHTGQLEYRGKGVRIDGGTPAADLVSFQSELGYAVAYADKIPGRFDRFARRVLGENASAEAKATLRQQLDQVLNAGLAENDAADARKLYVVQGGFGRTDALARIGNYVFGTELDNANLRVANAPVKLPPLWYTSWFGWVQYNASIQQPMVRNIGESLGVRAMVNLKDPSMLFHSTANVANLWKIEQQLSGPTTFTGLKSPGWPAEVFGPSDQARAQKGAALYQQYCQKCHLPALNSPEIQEAQYWEPGLEGHRFLKLRISSLDEIGTDPHEAADWASRTAVTDGLGLGTVPATVGLRLVTTKVRDLGYAALGLTPEQRAAWNGYRNDAVIAPLGYRARPLGGMWATPPFLHNGSVPSLYQLLLPAGQRDQSFYTGSREFDPKVVGYQVGKFKDGFHFLVDRPGDPHPGNSNAGHSFENTPGKGVIGPELTDEQRWALIEYLKTL